MRDYIQKHIKEPVASYIKAVYEAAAKDYDEHAYSHSSIHGKVTDRSMIKDSFVFGDVVMKGDCKMLGCVVAPDTTVIMEPGAVAINCMFGQHRSDALARTIHIGHDAVVAWSQIDMQTTVGKDSCIYGSLLECIYSYSQFTPFVTIGNKSLLANACLRIIRPRCRFATCDEDASQMQTPAIRFGNRTVIIHAALNNSDNTFETGDDVVIGSYDALLQTCLGELVDVIRAPASHPAAQGFNSSDNVLACSMPDCTMIDDTTIGNRVTLMASLSCHETDYAAIRNKVEIDDDVIVGIDQFLALSEYTDPGNYGLAMHAGDVILEQGSTLIMSGEVTYGKHNGKIHLGEGSTAVMPQCPRGDNQTNALEINIMPNAVVAL